MLVKTTDNLIYLENNDYNLKELLVYAHKHFTIFIDFLYQGPYFYFLSLDTPLFIVPC